jgi:hypothetical protein
MAKQRDRAARGAFKASIMHRKVCGACMQAVAMCFGGKLSACRALELFVLESLLNIKQQQKV